MLLVLSERSIVSRVAAPLIGGLLAAALGPAGVRAAPGEASRSVYVIPAQDGYGVVECLTQKRDCGKIVADSWCEAHGHGPALSFGRADDVTASIGPASRRQPLDADAAIVACGD